jgi:hypothetical protein
VVDLLSGINADLPLELQALPNDDEEQWAEWIAFRDTEIRARLAQGDQDVLVSWLLEGSTFTSQPRLDPAALAGPVADPQTAQRQAAVLAARIDDFVRALAAPGADERRQFARRFFEGNGFKVSGGEAGQLREHLGDAVQLFVLDRQVFADRLASIARGSPAEAEAIMASLFQEKGLSLEAPLAPNYAVERSLVAMKALDLLKPGGVARVAIVGPGLSFSESDSGFDAYPLQMVQPFAVLDSLRKLQLAPATGKVDMVLMDISPRVLEHVARAKAQAARGQGYRLTLSLAPDRSWSPAFRDYWTNAGSQVSGGAAPAAQTSATPAPQAGEALRTVTAAAEAVGQVATVDLNVVTDRLDGPPFDLIVVTNVLPYYGRIDQALASSCYRTRRCRPCGRRCGRCAR